MDSGRNVANGAGLGLLEYVFVGMTAVVMLLAVTVVVVEVTWRARVGQIPADVSAAQR